MTGPDGMGEASYKAKSDAFYLRVAYALSGCQLVEQQLKLYIAEAYELIRKYVGDKLPFKMSGDDVENSSLEHLIKTFRKLCNNDALLKDLEHFKDERNFLSHKAIAHALDLEDELNYGSMVEVESRLDKIQNEAPRLRSAIYDEAGKFLGHLYFGKVTDG